MCAIIAPKAYQSTTKWGDVHCRSTRAGAADGRKFSIHSLGAAYADSRNAIEATGFAKYPKGQRL